MALELLGKFTDVLGEPDEICDSQPLSLSFVEDPARHDNSVVGVSAESNIACNFGSHSNVTRPVRGTGQHGEFRSVDEIDAKYRSVFSYPFFNLVQSRVLDDALYSDKPMVVCAPTGSGKTVVFEMAIVHLLMELEDKNEGHDFKIIYMAPVKALCTERLTEWYSKFTKLGLLCIEVTGDTDVDFTQLKPYRIIITTPEKWDMLTRRWRDHRQLVELIKLFLIDEVHILNDETRGPVLEAVVSRMKTIETSVQSSHRIEQLQHQYQGTENVVGAAPNIRFIAVSATVGNPEDVAAWLGTTDKPAVYYKFGDECRPVKLKRIVEGYPCAEGTSIFKFDLLLNYKLWPIIQKYHNGKPTLIFCNTRKSVALTAETLSREITISFNEEQRSRLTALASMIKNKKLQMLVLSGVGCHHAGLLYEERTNIEQAFRNRDLPILITTTTLAMGVNLPAHLVIIKNTQQYVSGAYQEYSISTVLQMVGRAGRPQFDTEATAVIMTRLADKPRYQALVGGSEPLQSYLHKRLPENLNSEAALGTVSDVAQCVQWLQSTFLSVRAAKDPKRYLGLPQTAPHHQISKKVEELCVKAMNGLASSGLITMDEACCIESTEAGRLMSIYYLDLATMKNIMKIEGSESLDKLLWIVCESHELADMHLRMDERRCLNTLNRNNAAATIRFPMKGKITTRQMKLNCVIQAILGCLPIPDPSLNQEAMKIMRTADRVCKCLVAYVTRPTLVSQQPKYYSAILNTITLAKCVATHLWENSPFVCKQLKGIGPTFSTLLATAGKVNFMLLEESHPRDLERIMNKGPPAGNILRKQISLFPKYQVTMTPIDEKVVSVQLTLLNHHNLTENLENLTAGASHKSYLIMGDSENVILFLASFTDKDLIGVYDGSITYQITRKHGFEHKIYAHCVSSSIAGIDAHCEYLFKHVEPQTYPLQSSFNDELTRHKKQTTITDTFKQRKRKNTDNEITQSKEKKKRESALFEKFKNLKESFGKTSQVLKTDLNKSAVVSAKILQDLKHLQKPSTVNSNNMNNEQNERKELQPSPVKSTFFEESNTYEINDDDFINDEFIDDDKINNILNEIECEISKGSSKHGDKTKLYSDHENYSVIQKAAISRPIDTKYVTATNTYPQIENYKTMNSIKKCLKKNIPKKSNYNFIDLLEKNEDLSDTDQNTVKEQNSFSDTIRCHVEKYLQKTKMSFNTVDIILKDLIEDDQVQCKEIEPVVITQNSIRSKDDYDANRTMKLETTDSNNAKPMITEVGKPTIDNASQQVSVLEHKILSIDLTTDEFPSIDSCSREFHDEQELQAIELGKNKNYDTDFEMVELMERKDIAEDHNKHSEVNSNNIDESRNEQMLVLTESKNGKNIGGDKRTQEPDLKNLVPLIGPKKKDLDWPTAQCSITALKENEGLSKFELIDRDYKNVPIALPSIISRVSKSSQKQELPVLELWKNYIKELPPLYLQRNNNEVTKYNNSCPFNIKKDVIEQNDGSDKQSALPNKINLDPEVLETLDLLANEPTRNNKGFLTPQCKYNKTGATENPPPSTQNDSNKPTAISESIANQRRFEIEVTKNRKQLKEITCNTSTPAFGNQLASTQQNCNYIMLPTSLPSAHYHNPETNQNEIQESLQIEPPKSNEYRDIRTFSFASSSYSGQQAIQQNYSKLPYISSDTVSRVLELKEIHDFPKIELRENYIKETTPYSTNMNGGFGVHPLVTELNYSNDKVPFVLPSTPNLPEKQNPSEIETPSTISKEIKLYNTCAMGDLPAFTRQENISDSSYTKSQKNYINKYSFSSNKIDVSTQETADHVVRVIRKLRIDLDVTELVSEEEKTMENTNKGPDIEELNSKENPAVAFKKQKLKSAPNIEQNSEITKKMVATFSSKFENSIRTDNELLEKHNPKALLISDNNVTGVHKLTEKASISASATEPTQLSSNTKQVEFKEGDHSEEINKYNERDLQTFSEFKITASPVERKPDNTESIFQKYSNIMRNRNTINSELSLCYNKTNDKCSSMPRKDKPRRPFKISDIYHRNPATLPRALTENPKAVHVTERFNLLEPNDKHTQLEQKKQFNICESVTIPSEPVFEQKYNEDIYEVQNASISENLEDDCDSSYVEDLKVKDTVSNIVQTMFNPKTLLQCFSTDESEDFIPPPPEFSDNFHARLNTNADITLPEDCDESMIWEDESDESHEGVHNRSIFQGSQVDLTPSKEIETWNLSKHEGSCKMYDSFSASPYSFAIMRKNKSPTKLSALSNSLLKSAIPRRNKLEQFKFNRKNKLNLR